MRIGIWAYHWNDDFMTAPWRALFEIVTALAARDLDDEVICLTKIYHTRRQGSIKSIMLYLTAARILL